MGGCTIGCPGSRSNQTGLAKGTKRKEDKTSSFELSFEKREREREEREVNDVTEVSDMITKRQ